MYVKKHVLRDKTKEKYYNIFLDRIRDYFRRSL